MKGTRLIHKVIPILVLNIVKVMGVLFLFVVVWGPSSNNLLIPYDSLSKEPFHAHFKIFIMEEM
jgi:hypothetical protein